MDLGGERGRAVLWGEAGARDGDGVWMRKIANLPVKGETLVRLRQKNDQRHAETMLCRRLYLIDRVHYPKSFIQTGMAALVKPSPPRFPVHNNIFPS